jgi:ubiquinol-cytochrome c reductase cytochrome c subunit
MPARIRCPRPLLGVGFALAVTGAVTVGTSTTRSETAMAQPGPASTGNPQSGEAIWKQDCAICHGNRGEGSFQGPDIRQQGTASVDFMVRTGRMPLAFRREGSSVFPASQSQSAERGPVAYSDQQIRDLVAYTSGFLTGPPVPPAPDLAGADVARGGELYRLNCAACHQMAGSGGALAWGTVGPPLRDATPTEVVEAMRTGPGSMPVFPPSVIDEQQTRDITAYVTYLKQPEDRGGAPLWHIGPVGEGLVAWVFGIGAIVLLCRWLGQRDRVTTHG